MKKFCRTSPIPVDARSRRRRRRTRGRRPARAGRTPTSRARAAGLKKSWSCHCGCLRSCALLLRGDRLTLRAFARAALAVLGASCHSGPLLDGSGSVPSTIVSSTPAGEPPKTTAAAGSSTGSYGLPASENDGYVGSLSGLSVPTRDRVPARGRRRRGEPRARPRASSAPAAVPRASAMYDRGCGAPRRCRTTASTPASRSRARPAGRRRRSRQRRDAAAEQGVRPRTVSDRRPPDREQRDLVGVHVDAVRARRGRARGPLSSVSTARLPAAAHEMSRLAPTSGPCRRRAIVLFPLSARCVPTGTPEREAPAVDLDASTCRERGARRRPVTRSLSSTRALRRLELAAATAGSRAKTSR